MKYRISEVQDRIKVGERVLISNIHGIKVEGIIGEIRGNLFYFWNNELDGGRGSGDPSTKGFKYSYCMLLDGSSDIEFLDEEKQLTHYKVISIFKRKK